MYSSKISTNLANDLERHLVPLHLSWNLFCMTFLILSYILSPEISHIYICCQTKSHVITIKFNQIIITMKSPLNSNQLPWNHHYIPFHDSQISCKSSLKPMKTPPLKPTCGLTTIKTYQNHHEITICLDQIPQKSQGSVELKQVIAALSDSMQFWAAPSAGGENCMTFRWWT